MSKGFSKDLNEYAVETLGACSAVTNQLLAELIESINAAQTQDRQWIVAALGRIELNRRQDKALFGNSLKTLALQTEDELIRTREDLTRLVVYNQPDNLIQNRPEILKP